VGARRPAFPGPSGKPLGGARARGRRPCRAPGGAPDPPHHLPRCAGRGIDRRLVADTAPSRAVCKIGGKTYFHCAGGSSLDKDQDRRFLGICVFASRLSLPALVVCSAGSFSRRKAPFPVVSGAWELPVCVGVGVWLHRGVSGRSLVFLTI